MSTGARYSISRATATDRCWIALKYASWAPATANTPYPSTTPALRRSAPHRPRSASSVGTPSTTAATPTRNVTTAPGLHPVSRRGRATAPEVPNAAADARACLLYTSDAADDLLCVDLGGRRIIK